MSSDMPIKLLGLLWLSWHVSGVDWVLVWTDDGWCDP